MSRISAAAKAPQPTSPPIPGACPRCQQPMIDPQGLGWCKACGYCRSLEEGEKKAASAPNAVPNQITATGAAIGQSPTWFWVTLIGLILIVGATAAGAHYLVLTPLERALLTSGQIIVGLAAMFLGQFIGLLRIAPEDSALGLKDAIFPFRLYALALKRLPRTRHTLYLGVWGAAAILSAVVFIGGVDYWFSYLKNKNKNQPTPVHKAKK
jgi:hypothetical protein